MNNGNVNNNNKTNNNHVWPVRGGERQVPVPEPFTRALRRRPADACPDANCLFRYAPRGCGFTCGLTGYQTSAHPLFRPEAVFTAYRRCRRRKRNTINAQRFEAGLEENLFALSRELSSGTYQPGRSVVFLVNKPKRREIFAADFRDRVVHHLLVDELEPEWEKRFIFDSYACRRDKGTHKAVDRLRSFCRKVTRNGTRRAWYLQLDIRGFFIHIDRRVLFERLAAFEEDPVRLDLIRRLVFHEPVDNCLFKGCRQEDCLRLPSHKTLFHAASFKGLPIGNLTSQFFANVYLDMLDQFVKRRLGVRYYVRYCDDFVLLADDRAQLKAWEREIERFLTGHLKLNLNPKRTLRRVSNGIDFLGYIVRPDYLLVRRRVVNALRERLDSVAETPARENPAQPPEGSIRTVIRYDRKAMRSVSAWLNSYHGHFRRASSHRLQQSVFLKYPWLNEWFFDRPPFHEKHPPPDSALRLSRQAGWYRRQFPGHVLCVRLGNGFRLYPATEKQQDMLNLFGFSRGVPPSMERTLREHLWSANIPVVWIERTEKFNGFVYERMLTEEWKPMER